MLGQNVQKLIQYIVVTVFIFPLLFMYHNGMSNIKMRLSVYCEVGTIFEYKLDILQASKCTNRNAVNCSKCSVITVVDYFF
jgi:hypothetical protein